jgi:hypothetical protein
MGSTIVTETWQPGKVLDKIESNYNTYLKTMNYWVPLDTIDEKEEEGEEINSTFQQPQPTRKKHGNK